MCIAVIYNNLYITAFNVKLMKFAHIGDCHLGSWAEPELRELNLNSFQTAIDRCIREKVDFILITGDLFDSAYPPIDVLKETFREFRKLKEAGIPAFLIAGSHDYSVSGKTFLDVLDKAGFAKNVEKFIEKDGKIMIEPTIYKNAAIYGYPGRKSGLEVDEIEKIKLQDAPGLFRILMLHTAIRGAVGNLPIKAVDEKKLPNVNYLALSHLHINYIRDNCAYSGVLFPNNISELEELKNGSFCIFDNGRIRREEIKIKEVEIFEVNLDSALNAKDKIISSLKQGRLFDRIVILKLQGILESGKISDIDFNEIEDFVRKEKAYSFLKSTSRLFMHEYEMKVDLSSAEALEAQIIKRFEEKNQGKFNFLIPELFKTLQIDKQDDEKNAIYEERLMAEAKRVLEI